MYNEELLKEAMRSKNTGLRTRDKICRKLDFLKYSFDDLSTSEEEKLYFQRFDTLLELIGSLDSSLLEFNTLLDNGNVTNSELKKFIDKINNIYKKNEKDDENDYFQYFDND